MCTHMYITSIRKTTVFATYLRMLGIFPGFSPLPDFRVEYNSYSNSTISFNALKNGLFAHTSVCTQRAHGVWANCYVHMDMAIMR